MAGFLPTQAQAGEGGNDNDSGSDSDDNGGLPYEHLTPANLSIDYIVLDDLW